MKLNALGLFSGLIVSSAVLSAQQPPTTPPSPPTRAQQERDISRGPGAAGPRRENLTPEQREKLKAAMDKLRESQQPIMEKLRTTRRELEQGALSGDLDEQALRAKAAELGKLEGELAIARANYYREVRGFMPADQVRAPGRIPGEGPGFGQRLERTVRRGGPGEGGDGRDGGDGEAPERPQRRGPRPGQDRE